MTFTARFLAYLERQSRLFLWLTIAVSVSGLAIIDYKTGPDFSISLFYVFPVALASLALGRSEGILVSILCAAIWEVLRLPADQLLGGPLVGWWNGIARLGLLSVISLLFAEIHTLFKNESHLSRTDYLTGILNRRALMEAASLERARMARTGRPFTLIYMDLDNFKSINDTAGHEAGDSLLIRVAALLTVQLRGTDIAGRVGGDEFAAILPETDDQAARKVVARLQSSFAEEMYTHHWPITFSIGVLSCLSTPSGTDELFRLVDQLMYEAKKEGKNTIRYRVYGG
ncbi:MAG TPA: GGDEF domain-containing protein [Anaerolineales bacterium]|nr:GGDEF domain-containing protein [Anaerolineales bacterium]